MDYHNKQVAAGRKRREHNTPIGSKWRVEICGSWLPFSVSAKYKTTEGWWVSLRGNDGKAWGNVPLWSLGERVA